MKLFEEWAGEILLEDAFVEDSEGILVEESFEGYFDRYITETIKKKHVMRDGKPHIKYYSTLPGYKVIVKDNVPEERRISPKERMARKIGAKKGASRRRSKSKQSALKRKRTMQAKKRFGGQNV